jgi:uncharacterized protein (TIGR04222 family)
MYALLVVGVVVLAWFLTNPEALLGTLPKENALSPIAIAYLRGGVRSVVLAVVHRLYERGKVEVDGAGAGAVLTAKGALEAPADAIEPLVHGLLREPTAPRTLLKDANLEGWIERILGSDREALERMALLRSADDRMRAWMVACFATACLWAVGGAKLWFGLQRNKPVMFLVLLLCVATVAPLAAVRPWRTTTRLGKRYLDRLRDHFAWLEERSAPELYATGFDPALTVAVFGLDSVLMSHSLYGAFEGSRHSSWSTGSYFGDGSSCGSSCGGGGSCGSSCGGGCGGCGS